mmetsp:Transcript_11749/g.26922  ORF Transcript_11749/g.26922 Transcript_11749/m.26922 type:complete len:235 (+) Transcript_11749:2260-2964(+)
MASIQSLDPTSSGWSRLAAMVARVRSLLTWIDSLGSAISKVEILTLSLRLARRLGETTGECELPSPAPPKLLTVCSFCAGTSSMSSMMRTSRSRQCLCPSSRMAPGKEWHRTSCITNDRKRHRRPCTGPPKNDSARPRRLDPPEPNEPKPGADAKKGDCGAPSVSTHSVSWVTSDSRRLNTSKGDASGYDVSTSLRSKPEWRTLHTLAVSLWSGVNLSISAVTSTWTLNGMGQS